MTSREYESESANSSEFTLPRKSRRLAMISSSSALRRLSIAVFASLSIASLTEPARAVEVTISGSILSIRGAIRDGDEFTYRDTLATVPKGQIRLVDLDSPGGKIAPATEIARSIRAAGLSTLVDASRSNCASACTVLFAGGVHRHYLNASKIVDSVQPRGGHGLGYHEGNSSLSLSANHYSGRASAEMISAYYEFGVARAADLLTRAPPEKLYRISGPTALGLGIATSLDKP